MSDSDPAPVPAQQEQTKHIQEGTDVTLGHGKYVEDKDAQDALWATAVTVDGEPHPDRP